MKDSVLYTYRIAAILCIICSVLVSTAFVTLKPAQEKNKTNDKRRNILLAAGLVQPKDNPSPEKIETLFESIQPVMVDLTKGVEISATSQEIASFDEKKMSSDPSTSSEIAPDKDIASVRRLPNRQVIYKLVENGQVQSYILPIKGMGLWSVLHGFMAISADAQSVRGITFYQHGETPGLGGEVDNPKWKSLWPGRKIYGENGDVKLEVIKGQAGSVEQAPYKVDGLAGATITSRGVSNLVKFWLGENGYFPYLKQQTGVAL